MPHTSRDLNLVLEKQRKEAEEKDAMRRAKSQGLPYLNLISTKVPTEIKALAIIPEAEAKKALLVPIDITQKKVVIAAFDPERPEAKTIIEELQKKYEVNITIVSMQSLAYAMDFYRYVMESKEISGKVEINEENLRSLEETIKTLADLGQKIKNFKSPYTSQVLEIVLAGALSLKASDIHLEPGEHANAFRLRIDGILHIVTSEFPSIVYKSIITRIKLLSELKLNIKDEPQDGRFTISLKDRSIEIRTSVIPSEYGETVVMRLLDPIALKTNLEELGWRTDDLEIIKKELEKPNGLILNTGPTGSGKTTTLYAFLRKVSRPEIKIITIEDPIEYHLAGISQTQVDPAAHYTFASGLRSILRQDPDIVLVGEIRDKETAEIALNASLTGHLVFSTLHTNDAIGAIPRLIDLGANPQILGSGLSLVIAQRLVRLLCPQCKKEKTLDASTKVLIKDFLKKLPKRVAKETYKDARVFSPRGCEVCGGIGYKGRTSIFELFVINEKMEEAIYKNPTEITLKVLARGQEMVTMQEDGLLKMFLGTTSLEEVERLTGPVEWLH